MNRRELARLLDQSVLAPEATERDILSGAEVVREWAIGYYCVQPCWVRTAARALEGGEARVVSVAGFPHGCERTAVKARSAALAVEDGAAEIDMVISFGALKSGATSLVAEDIATVVRAVSGVPVKVIIEASALTDGEKRLACRISREAGAAFVKTSTGFHPTGGAAVADVRLIRDAVGTAMGVKASGRIRTLEDVLAMLAAGASRIGTSSGAAILGRAQAP